MGIVAAGKRRIEGFVGIERESGNPPVARLELYQHFGQPGVTGRSRDQTHVRRPVEYLLAFLLGHATDDREDLPGAGSLEVLKTREDLLFGFIANAACIVENIPCCFGRIDLCIPLLE